jgi:hypothetical protein
MFNVGRETSMNLFKESMVFLKTATTGFADFSSVNACRTSYEQVGCREKAGQTSRKRCCWNTLSLEEKSRERSKSPTKSLQTEKGHQIRCEKRKFQSQTLVVLKDLCFL